MKELSLTEKSWIELRNGRIVTRTQLFETKASVQPNLLQNTFLLAMMESLVEEPDWQLYTYICNINKILWSLEAILVEVW